MILFTEPFNFFKWMSLNFKENKYLPDRKIIINLIAVFNKKVWESFKKNDRFSCPKNNQIFFYVRNLFSGSGKT
jgi:predicted nucleotide-binding protein (sugar kinase/HSP70/actin superfamily)